MVYEFISRINEICRLMSEQFDGTKMEAVNTWCGQTLKNVVQYASTSEACMEIDFGDGSSHADWRRKWCDVWTKVYTMENVFLKAA